MAEKKSESESSCKGRRSDRRDFLRQVSGGALAAAAAASLATQGALGAPETKPAPSAKSALLPTIKIGDKTVTRMIAGGNPVQGYSHSVQKLNQHMMEYFTVERTTEFLLNCEKAGINTFQCSYSDKVRDALNKAWEAGSKIQWICLTADDKTQTPLDKVLPLKPIGISHHGVVTDSRFREDKPEQIHDYIKKVHDLGLLAGMSSHNPNNIRAAEEKGWENDFFMTCFYNVVRTDDDLKKEFGAILLGETYPADDPKKMTAVVRQSKKICLGFKILAAGRLSGDPFKLQQAFRFAFQNIKPTDAVIVGMYPRFHDEISENVGLARKFATIKA